MKISRKTKIYLDNAAAAKPELESLGRLYEYSANYYANQEAAHDAAYDLTQKLSDAGKRIATLLSGDNNYIFWGSSGTDLFRLLGLYPKFTGGNIVTSRLEHPALLAALQRTGAKIDYVNLKQGQIDLEHLAELVTAKTCLVALHYVQSETGLRQDLVAIGKTIKKLNPQTLFLVDAIQATGKLQIPFSEAKVNVVAASSHKVGIPGSAVLVIDSKSQTAIEVYKFLQTCRKKNYLQGKPEFANCLALSDCLAKRYANLENSYQRIAKLNATLREQLPKIKLFNSKKILFTTSVENSSPYIANFIVPGYQSGVLIRMLSELNVYCSAGSACQAESDAPSPALTALGFSRQDAFAGMRVSFAPESTLCEVEEFMQRFAQVIKDY